MSCTDCFQRPGNIPGIESSPVEVMAARDRGQLFTLDLEMTEACNGACVYCYRYGTDGPAPPASDELTLAEIEMIIAEAKGKHGLRRLYILGGEPLLPGVREKFFGTLRACNELGVGHVTLTNGLCLTRNIARKLREHKASVCVKLNGMTAAVHDQLVGVPGAFDKAMRAFDYLLAAGYGGGDQESQLGFETVVTKSNYDQIEQMWIWARERGILPFVEKLTIQGRSVKHRTELQVGNDELRRLFERLNQIDRVRYGYDWDITPPIAGGYHCVRFYVGLYVRANGIVCPCVGVDINLGNLRRETISEITSSPLAQATRHIDNHIKGKCRHCDLSRECYGCRGAAYQAGDVFAEDPNCWR